MTLTPGFQIAEAIDIMRLAFVVDADIKAATPINKPLISAAEEEHMLNPLPRPLMPSGWEPMPSASGLWRDSICDSLLLNRAMLVRRMTTGGVRQYCLAFRGTTNLANVLQDGASQYTVPAGPIDLPPVDINKLLHLDKLPFADKIPQITIPSVKSTWSYTNGSLPTDSRAHTALGFRLALESLNYKTSLIKTLEPIALIIQTLIDNNLLPATQKKLLLQFLSALSSPSLSDMLGHIEEDEPEIYVTGHSLGAAMAQLAAAWLAAGGLPGKKPKVKLYAFAAPKPGEEYLSYSARYTMGPDMAYCVNNVIDSVPQVGLSLELPSDLVSTGVLEILQLPANIIKVLDNLKLPSPMNLTHIGSVIPLSGVLPIEMKASDFIPPIFLAPSQGEMTLEQWAGGNEGQANLLGTIWQHMPWVYLWLLAGKPVP
jgi:hypothetical protein